MRRAGFARIGKPPAFFAMQGERVATDGHPGLARSMDSEAQWIYGGPENPLTNSAPDDGKVIRPTVDCLRLPLLDLQRSSPMKRRGST